MFHRTVFDIAIANDDDHAWNHAFLMDSWGEWMLSSAYDMTRSGYALGSSFRAAGLMGKFSKIGLKDLRGLAAANHLRGVEDLISGVRDAVSRWPEFAGEAGLSLTESSLLQDEFPVTRW